MNTPTISHYPNYPMIRTTSPMRRSAAIGDGAILTVSIAMLRGNGHFRDASPRTTTYFWKDALGREVVRLKVLSQRGSSAAAYVHIEDLRDRRNKSQRIDVVGTAGVNDSCRWWFVCPVTGRRVSALHRPLGTRLFAARHAHGLKYATQRFSPRVRALRVLEKVHARLGCTPRVDPRTLPRPKGMHRRTHEKLVSKAVEAHQVLQGYAERWRGREVNPSWTPPRGF